LQDDRGQFQQYVHYENPQAEIAEITVL